MAWRPLVLAMGLAMVLTAAATNAGAAEDVPTLGQCKASFDRCMTACEAANPEAGAGLAGCQARCAAERAGCEAKAGYEQAKPWVQEQFENMQKFFDGFSKGPEGGSAPPTDKAPSSDGPADSAPKDI